MEYIESLVLKEIILYISIYYYLILALYCDILLYLKNSYMMLSIKRMKNHIL